MGDQHSDRQVTAKAQAPPIPTLGGTCGSNGFESGRVGGGEARAFLVALVNWLCRIDTGRLATFRVQAVEFVKVGIALGGVQCWFSQAHAEFMGLGPIET